MSETILFLCPHNAAKSLIASVYFNRLAECVGLSVRGDSAGTEPSEAVLPVVAEMLLKEGIDISAYKPRHTTPEELQTAACIISIGCTPQELSEASAPIEYWDDVPMVSQDPEGSRDAIRVHIAQLVERLQQQ
jgi:protein-tyrosine-phosphatase